MPKSLYKLSYIALYTSLAYILYLIRIPLPFFPSFLKLNLADVPLILGTFQLGTIPGVLIVLVRCILKLPLSRTLYIGELADFIMGLVLVISIGTIYKIKRNIFGAALAIIFGIVISSLIGALVNYYLLIPLYVKATFHGNEKELINVLPQRMKSKFNNGDIKKLIVFAGVFPFNLFRALLNGIIGYVLYKFNTTLEGKMGNSVPRNTISTTYRIWSLKRMKKVAQEFARTLRGGEIIILNGELGAGKTTFTKLICESLGVKETVNSPTFTIQNIYNGKCRINHIDMYRLENEDELYEVGMRDEIGMGDTITFIEWNKFDNLVGNIYWVNIEKTFFNKFRKIEIVK